MDLIENIKKWFDEVYETSNDKACLELPILKVLCEKNDWVKRDELIESIKKKFKVDFGRKLLSLDHLFSHRFGKGEEKELLNKIIEYKSAGRAGAVKEAYKIKSNIKDDICNLIKNLDYDEEKLINQRIVKINDKEKKVIEKTGETTMQNIPLNQILYGPPGTGKTYTNSHIFETFKR